MLEIGDLGLSPFQLAEVELAESDMIEAWLAHASNAHVDSPRGLFLWGLRSGRLPDSSGRPDEHSREILRAERWMQNVGYLLDREAEVIDELFGYNGPLRAFAGDVQLQARMLALWAELRPKGVRVEQEFLERAERNKETYRVLQEARRGRSSPA